MPFLLATDDEVITAIRAANGNLTEASRQLGMRTPQLRKLIFSKKSILEAYSESLDEICDLAISQLKMEILNGNIKAITYALDRLGHSRGFINQKTIIHGGDPFNPIQVENNISMDGLSIDEKRLLMKLAKDKVDLLDVPVNELETSAGSGLD